MKIAFTICSANYLPYAKSLGDSLIKYNPHFRFVIILLDKFPEVDLPFFSLHKIVHVQDMGVSAFEEMNNKYNIFELSCALKPFAANFIFKAEESCEQLFYFDADILIFSDLTAAEIALSENPILLTPHLTTSIEFDRRIEIEISLLRAGIYNGGFFALRRSEDTSNFLNWWMIRLENNCYNDLKSGLFVDQLWLNFIPSLFKTSLIFLNQGYNVAYWNFGERKISFKEEKYFINEEYPLVFFHFSGYDVMVENTLSKHFPSYSFENYRECIRLFELYRKAAMRNNIANLFERQPKLGRAILKKIEPTRERNFFKRKYKKWFLNNKKG